MAVFCGLQADLRRISNPVVAGSSPAGVTNLPSFLIFFLILLADGRWGGTTRFYTSNPATSRSSGMNSRTYSNGQ